MNNIEIIIISAALGILGALVRVLVTYIRAKELGRKMNRSGMILYVTCLFVLGAFLGIVLSLFRILSFLGGYLASDIMEGYYKVARKAKVKIRT